jgi:hypothetical protein
MPKKNVGNVPPIHTAWRDGRSFPAKSTLIEFAFNFVVVFALVTQSMGRRKYPQQNSATDLPVPSRTNREAIP